MTSEKYRLDNKVALITGGSRGIGKAIASAFVEAGADVVIASRYLPELEQAAKEITASGRRVVPAGADITKKEDLGNLVNKTMSAFGRIDILVNNAGISHDAVEMINAEEKVWDAVMELNLKSYFLLSQIVGKIMIKQGAGNIINLSSRVGVTPVPGLGVYSISKAGVIVLTKIMAMELGKYNIRVNAIAPGMTKTRLAQHRLENPVLFKRSMEHTALGRFAEPEDIAGPAVFLASEASRHISGQVVGVDGGWINH